MLETMFIYLGCLTSLMLSLEALKSYTEASSAPSSSHSISRLSARVTCQGEGNRTSQKKLPARIEH